MSRQCAVDSVRWVVKSRVAQIELSASQSLLLKATRAATEFKIKTMRTDRLSSTSSPDTLEADDAMTKALVKAMRNWREGKQGLSKNIKGKGIG
jgi:hypothetical protein